MAKIDKRGRGGYRMAGTLRVDKDGYAIFPSAPGGDLGVAAEPAWNARDRLIAALAARRDAAECRCCPVCGWESCPLGCNTAAADALIACRHGIPVNP